MDFKSGPGPGSVMTWMTENLHQQLEKIKMLLDTNKYKSSEVCGVMRNDVPQQPTQLYEIKTAPCWIKS